jgi:hypothetical protein
LIQLLLFCCNAATAHVGAGTDTRAWRLPWPLLLLLLLLLLLARML